MVFKCTYSSPTSNTCLYLTWWVGMYSYKQYRLPIVTKSLVGMNSYKQFLLYLTWVGMYTKRLNLISLTMKVTIYCSAVRKTETLFGTWTSIQEHSLRFRATLLTFFGNHKKKQTNKLGLIKLYPELVNLRLLVFMIDRKAHWYYRY